MRCFFECSEWSSFANAQFSPPTLSMKTTNTFFTFFGKTICTGKKKHTFRFTILNVDSRGKPKICYNEKRRRNDSNNATDRTDFEVRTARHGRPRRRQWNKPKILLEKSLRACAVVSLHTRCTSLPYIFPSRFTSFTNLFSILKHYSIYHLVLLSSRSLHIYWYCTFYFGFGPITNKRVAPIMIGAAYSERGLRVYTAPMRFGEKNFCPNFCNRSDVFHSNCSLIVIKYFWFTSSLFNTS